MRHSHAWICRNRARLTVLACLIGALSLPAIAYAYEIFTYAQGVYGVGGTYHTTGEAPRAFNRVYHQSGYYWDVYYCQDGRNPPCFGEVLDYHNPTYANGGASYAKSFCHNVNDNSGTTWTCQTTRNP